MEIIMSVYLEYLFLDDNTNSYLLTNSTTDVLILEAFITTNSDYFNWLIFIIFISGLK